MSSSDFPHLLYLGSSLYVFMRPITLVSLNLPTVLTTFDVSRLGSDRSDMFTHAFPNPVELTLDSSEEDCGWTFDGDGCSVWPTSPSFPEQTTS